MSFWEFQAACDGFSAANSPDDGTDTDMLALMRDWPDLADMIPVGGMN